MSCGCGKCDDGFKPASILRLVSLLPEADKKCECGTCKWQRNEPDNFSFSDSKYEPEWELGGEG